MAKALKTLNDQRVISILEGREAAQRGINLSKLRSHDMLPPEAISFVLVRLRLTKFEVRPNMTVRDIAVLLNPPDSEEELKTRYLATTAT